MPRDAKATTIYLKPDVHKALRLKAVETARSMSDLVNEAIAANLAEDLEDLRAVEERKGEETLNYSDFLEGLRADGTI